MSFIYVDKGYLTAIGLIDQALDFAGKENSGLRILLAEQLMATFPTKAKLANKVIDSFIANDFIEYVAGNEGADFFDCPSSTKTS